MDFEHFDEFYYLIEGNFWIEYFHKHNMHGKERWIDFEKEISSVIRSLDNDMHDLNSNCGMDDNAELLSNEFLNKRFYGSRIIHTYRYVRDKLLDDLNRLIRAFEIYLAEYVEKIECRKLSPDVSNVCFDAVLSFNYTNTYMRLYDLKQASEYDYIHGEVDLSNTIATDNMVLGIDEYLPEERRNSEVEFIGFKKFYQRILKGTGNRYKEWLDDIHSGQPIRNRVFTGVNENGNKIIRSIISEYHNLYIFGHSLDVTDKDILKELILHDKVKTTIFYNKSFDLEGNDDNGRKSLGEKIANLVKVIGQDELIRRTGGGTKTIEFKLQQKLVEK